MHKYDLVIVRPYVTFPSEGAGVDRYITLHKYALANGLKSLLLVSDFRHNQKEIRSPDEIELKGVELIKAGSYKSNISVMRLLYEIVFSYKACKRLKSLETKSILIGEPLFLGWIFFVWHKLKKRVYLFGDFIDLMPEAYRVKFPNPVIFWLLFWPFWFSRWLRANFIYDKVFTVSKTYVKRILINKNKNGGVFYWACQPALFDLQKNVSNVVVYVGSLGNGYDIETLIELGRIRPDLEVVIAGAGPKSYLCELAHNEGVIEYLGLIGTEKLQELYKRATYGILPYRKNSAVSMPIKFYEYLNNHLKIINSLDMECSDIISAYKLGFNYLPENVFSMSEAIHKSAKINVNSNAIKQLVSEYSIDMQYCAFIFALKHLLEGNSGRGSEKII
jgi:glycosyltransferase involved in cell wall biosynthesis